MSKYPQELTYDNGRSLVLDPGRLLLAFREPPEAAALKQFLKRAQLTLEDETPEAAVPGERVNHTDRRFWVGSRRELTAEVLGMIEREGAELGLEWVGPVYRSGSGRGRRGLLCPLPNVLLVGAARPREGHWGIGAALAEISGADAQLHLDEARTKYLDGFQFFVIGNPAAVNSYQLRAVVLERGIAQEGDLQFETMPLITPTAVTPNDPLFAQQWDMVRIQAGGPGTTGWDISTGVPGVVVCVLDEGCDLTHPDLRFATPGINLGTMMPDGAPTGNHGTACAGIVAATYDNGVGVAGVAGNARIMPLAFQSWTDVEVAAGINWARTNGARVISMSFGNDGWSHAIIDPAIQNAFNDDLVMCVATHNFNGSVTYPATNPLVMAIGASDEADNRKSPSSPDGESWGSNFGPEVSVVAPGVHIPTTDRQGTNGYNPAPGVAGNYHLTFNGTSSATPHVAGLAALVRSAYPALSNVAVRVLMERTADKVGTVAYAEVPGHPNGTWNQEMGYGRINVRRALDAADVLIKDAPADNGSEPFTGGNFWDFSDIVVRITDDGVFVPSDPARSKNVERGQANYIYVRVTNNGARDARNVTVSTRITPYVGLQFAYPQDWTLVDAMHVSPSPVTTTFASIPAGGTAMAKFRIEAAQTDTLYGWEHGSSWHPCLLAMVNADNDYAFATAPLTGDPISARRNNLAQRNLSVIDVLAGGTAIFPFVVGSRFDLGRRVSLLIDRSRLPREAALWLSLDDDGTAFPLVDFAAGTQRPGWDDRGKRGCRSGIVFLERTRIQGGLGCDGVLTLEAGSRLDCAPQLVGGEVTVRGGDVVLRGGRRYVEIREPQVRVDLDREPGSIRAMSLRLDVPTTAEKGDELVLQVAQQDGNQVTVGGAAAVYLVG